MLAWIQRIWRLLRAGKRLAELERLLRSQGNRATAWPLFVVEEEERIYGIDPAFGTEKGLYVWHNREDSDCWCETDDDLLEDYADRIDVEAAREEMEQENTVDLDGHRWDKVYYETRWGFVCAHLTEGAADLYIAQNSHNLKKPRVYVTSQHRCYEWQDTMLALGAPHG